MALPTGNFSYIDSGLLRVVFNGTWWINDAAPTGAGAFELVLRAYVGSGDSRKTALMSSRAATAVLEVSYAGSYAAVPVGMEYVSNTLDGPGTVCAYELSVTCHLLPEA